MGHTQGIGYKGGYLLGLHALKRLHEVSSIYCHNDTLPSLKDSPGHGIKYVGRM